MDAISPPTSKAALISSLVSALTGDLSAGSPWPGLYRGRGALLEHPFRPALIQPLLRRSFQNASAEDATLSL